MDAARRKQLEERRRFMHERNAARAQRQAMEPALSALEQAGETFRVYRLGTEPHWNPRWIPSGYSYIPWHDLPGVETRKVNDRPAMAEVLRELLAERLKPEDEFLFVPAGKGWSIVMLREGFDRHAEALLDVAWDNAYLAAPPAQWLLCGDWSRVMWKDG